MTEIPEEDVEEFEESFTDRVVGELMILGLLVVGGLGACVLVIPMILFPGRGTRYGG